MDLMQDIIARAKADKQRIVLPEGTEERTLKAADRLLADGVADIILIGNPAEIKELAAGFGLNHIGEATLVDPKNHEKKAAYADLLFQLRQKKGMTPEKAAVLVEDPLFLACLMIKAGDADGEIAGAENTTGNVLRPALQIIKTAPGMKCVSGAFLMFTQTPQYGDNGILVFADCAVMPNPNAEELASIAVATAATARNIVGVEPRVAMLSFSTKGSASHEMVDKVVEATRLAKEMAPDLKIDGELQADAAFTIDKGQKNTQLLIQPQYSPMPVEEQISILYCGTQGLLKEVPLDKVHEFEARFLQELRTSHQRDVLDVLKTGVINDEIRGILEKTAKELWVH